MNLLKQAMTVLGAVLTIAVLVAVISPKTAQAVAATLVQIQPGSTTHVGQNETQLVSLVCNENPVDNCITLAPDASTGTSQYVVPSGFTLIVTDWEYFASDADSSPGSFIRDELFLNGNTGKRIALSTTLTQGSTSISAHERYETGLRIGSGQAVQDRLSAAGEGTAAIQGYLVPN
jgi:hypothetical protein